MKTQGGLICILQLSFPAYHDVNRNADDNGKKRSGGRGQAHREERVREFDGCQVGQRDTCADYRQEVVAEGDDRIAGGCEESAETEMDASEYAVPDVAFQVLSAKSDDCAVARE